MDEHVGTFTTPDGLGLRVAESGGPPGADDGPTLVLVHGWSQDLRTWDRVVADLRTAGVTGRVLRYDLRGHGGSQAPDPGYATVGRAADDLAALLTERVAGPVVLAGHSMGGMTLMALAERHPALVAERVVGIAFVATASQDMADMTFGIAGWPGAVAARGEHVVMPWMGRVGHRVPRVGLPADRGADGRVHKRAAALAPFVRALVFGSRPRRSDVLSVAEQALAADQAAVAAFRASIAEHRRTPSLAALRRCPGVVLVGDRDRLCPVARARTIADALPEAEFVLYPGAGHMITVERSTEVAAHLRGLLDAASPAPSRSAPAAVVATSELSRAGT